MNVGKCQWFIPDAYYPEIDGGEHYLSHEAVCILNVGDKEAIIQMTLFFENQEPMIGFMALCPAKRTNHVRMDKITNNKGESVPRGIPYAIALTSDVPIIVQYSRADTTQAELAFMGLMAY